MSQTRPTRRTVVRATAWSAPAIVVASAAPAMAASTASAPTFSFGTSRYVPFSNQQGQFYDVELRGASITATSPIAANSLTLQASFRPDEPWTSTPRPGLNGLFLNAVPTGWTAVSPAATNTSANSILLRYVAAAASGATIVIPTNTYIGINYQTNLSKGQGFLDVLLSIPGATSTVASLATPLQGGVN